MRRIFKRGETSLPSCSSSVPNYQSQHSTFNSPGIPKLDFFRTGDLSQAHLTLKTLPNALFDRIIYHCHSRFSPPHLPFMYELRRVVGGTVVLLHHSSENRSKKYLTAMHLAGYPFQAKRGRWPVSFWGGTQAPSLRCKTGIRLEEQPKEFYKSLIQGSKRVLEIFPVRALASREAVARNIPVTLFLLGEDSKSDKALIEELGGTL